MKAAWKATGHLCVLLSLILSLNSHARGSKPPKPEPTPTPTPTPDPVPDPIPDPKPPSEPVGNLEEIIKNLGQKVDQIHGSSELLKIRSTEIGLNDSCQMETRDEDRFMGRIARFIDEAQREDHVDLGGVADIYHVSSNPYPVSLHSHPMCNVSSSSLSQTLRYSNRVPSQSVINKLNQFANKYNQLRKDILNGKVNALQAMDAFWTQFMGCLAYKESLGSADSSNSYRVADKYAPSAYRKPAGVEFYEDPSQSPSSRLNIGLFQFTPNSSGNVRACINKWNRLYPQCQISTGSSQDTMIRNLGSSKQNFNAFCGVDKILQSFYVQVNATQSTNTFPGNLNKDPTDRCVSLHFYAGYAYNHFGPFQNTTGTNLNSLMSCALE